MNRLNKLTLAVIGVVLIMIIATVIASLVSRPQQYTGRGGATEILSQNGYPVIWDDSSPALWRWKIPGSTRTFLLRRGPAGFVLADFAAWYSAEIGGFDRRPDDHGWSLRVISGSDVWSNHSSGTALDINALNHPQGLVGTFSNVETLRIGDRLELMRVIRWGGNYRGRTDEMHWEINAPPLKVRQVAAWLRTTTRGQRVLALNRGRF